MPFADDLCDIASNAVLNKGAWYGQAGKLSPGAGIIFGGIPYPIFNPATSRYQVESGLVLILTHECDLDQSNIRAMNRSFLIAPLIQMKSFADNFEQQGLRENARSLIYEIATNRVHRLMYLPPPTDLLDVDAFPLGAFIYFNAITTADISHLGSATAKSVCALSELGLNVLDTRLKNHLFRPKAEQLPRTI